MKYATLSILAAMFGLALTACNGGGGGNAAPSVNCADVRFAADPKCAAFNGGRGGYNGGAYGRGGIPQVGYYTPGLASSGTAQLQIQGSQGWMWLGNSGFDVPDQIVHLRFVIGTSHGEGRSGRAAEARWELRSPSTGQSMVFAGIAQQSPGGFEIVSQQESGRLSTIIRGTLAGQGLNIVVIQQSARGGQVVATGAMQPQPY